MPKSSNPNPQNSIHSLELKSPKINLSKLFDDFYTPAQSRKIRYLVFHHIAANSSEEAIAMLRHHRVSAHFLIDEFGEIFALVREQDIAYHAGHSFWRGEFALNQSSIGIEFQNSNPFLQKFSEAQLKSGLLLAEFLIEKYQISLINVVGHSDIAFNPENFYLDRKQDPSHLFNWQIFAEKNLAVWPLSLSHSNNSADSQNKDCALLNPLFCLGDQDPKIAKIKENLNKFGYLVRNFDNNFDEEMLCLVRVFNRRFMPQSFDQKNGLDNWYSGSEEILQNLVF